MSLKKLCKVTTYNDKNKFHPKLIFMSFYIHQTFKFNKNCIFIVVGSSLT